MNTPYKIIRKPRRRRLSITISAHKDVQVLAPKAVSESEIHSFVEANSAWIDRTLKRVEKRYVPPKTFKEGELFMFLGENYPLTVQQGPKNHVEFNGQSLSVSYKKTAHVRDQVQSLLLKWYKERAKDIIPDRVVIHAEEMDLDYNDIRIKTLKTRWGSCSSLRNLNFNWVLMMAPIQVLDYVVIHELAHLVHMNHSKAFWAVVETYCPDYKTHIKWLKDNVGLLSII